MSRISQYTLKNGSSPSRISYDDETDAEVVTALHSHFGDNVVSAKVGSKTYQFNDGLENLLKEIYAEEGVNNRG